MVFVVSVLSLYYIAAAAPFSCRDPGTTELLQELYRELIPKAGEPTPYGIPISLWNVERFAGWFWTVTLTPIQRALLGRALEGLSSPVCPGVPLLSCCPKRTDDKGCILVQSALGLAKWLIAEKGFGAESVREEVSRWLRFIFPLYTLSQALMERGIDPRACGLPVPGVCYRGGRSGGASYGCEIVPEGKGGG